MPGGSPVHKVCSGFQKHIYLTLCTIKDLTCLRKSGGADLMDLIADSGLGKQSRSK